MKTLKLFLSAALTTSIFAVQAQDIQDSRVVGIVDFSSGRTQDSLASKDVNAAVSRVLIQTRRFTILDVPDWRKTQAEIDRQKDAAFMDQTIVQKGKSLGAKVLVVGSVKNAEIYKDNEHYSARVDYEVKFIDVESTKSIASNAFSGDSETLTNIGGKASNALKKMAGAALITGKGNWQKMMFSSAAFSALSEAEKNTVMGKLIDAIETTTSSLNAWIRGTFSINLLCLSASDEDKKKGFQNVVIEGGHDIGMHKGDELSLVLISQIQTSRGKIQDEVPVADIEVEEVRAATSMCKVVNGGKKISGDQAEIDKYRVVFKQKK